MIQLQEDNAPAASIIDLQRQIAAGQPPEGDIVAVDNQPGTFIITQSIRPEKPQAKKRKVSSCARTSGTSTAPVQVENVSYPADLFVAVPDQLGTEHLRKKVLIKQYEVLKKKELFYDKLITFADPIKAFLCSLPKEQMSEIADTDHPYNMS